jgi:hypothetical protein
MFDTFNEDVRRVANLLAYEQPTTQIPPMLVAAAKLYLSWDGEMPEPVIRTAPETASGEIAAR